MSSDFVTGRSTNSIALSESVETLKNVNTSDVEKLTDLDKQNLDVEGNNNKQSTTLDKEKDASVGISVSTACCHSQTLRDSRWSSLCSAHGRFEDPSNLVFKLIIALI